MATALTERFGNFLKQGKGSFIINDAMSGWRGQDGRAESTILTPVRLKLSGKPPKSGALVPKVSASEKRAR